MDKMINISKIKLYFMDNNISISKMAKECNISRVSLSRKINGNNMNWKFIEFLYLKKLTNIGHDEFYKLINIGDVCNDNGQN